MAITLLITKILQVKKVRIRLNEDKVFKVIWKNIRDRLSFVFEVVWKNHKVPWSVTSCVWYYLKESRRNFCVLFLKQFERISGTHCICFWSSFKEFRHPSFCFWSNLKASRRPLLFCFWILETTCILFLKQFERISGIHCVYFWSTFKEFQDPLFCFWSDLKEFRRLCLFCFWILGTTCNLFLK